MKKLILILCLFILGCSETHQQENYYLFFEMQNVDTNRKSIWGINIKEKCLSDFKKGGFLAITEKGMFFSQSKNIPLTNYQDQFLLRLKPFTMAKITVSDVYSIGKSTGEPLLWVGELPIK